jgi:WD40 repeat protein
MERETLRRKPFVGLVPFSEDDSEFFFGRSRERRIVASNLKGARLTLLYGPSGVGKSSLLLAGVVHDLREQVAEQSARDGREPFAVCVLRSWRDDPLAGLAKAIADGVAGALGREPEPAWTPDRPLAETLHAWTPGLRRLLVVLDQFEDYFLYHAGESGRAFADEFAGVVNDPTLRVNVMVSLREDAWAKLDLFKASIPQLFSNYLRVDYLDRAAATEAVVKPIEELNRHLPEGEERYSIDDDLVAAVLDAAGSGRLALAAAGNGAEPEKVAGAQIETPFLQLVMERLWRAVQEAGTRELTLETLTSLGGAQRIVETHLLDALGALDTREQELAALAFQYLVTRSRTKIAHSDSDLADWTKQPEPEVASVLEKLSRGETGRILRRLPSADESTGTRYELFHDVLADPVIEWRKRYEQAREHAEETKRQSEARRRIAKRVAIGVGTVLLTAFAVLSVYAVNESRVADRQRARAEQQTDVARSHALVASSVGQLDTDPQLSLLLAREAAERYPTPEAEQALREALSALLLRATLRGHKGIVHGASFSPDGTRVVTAGEDGTARIWDASSGEQVAELRGHKARLPSDSYVGPAEAASVYSAQFSPGGKRVVTASDDGTARVWNAASGDQLHVLTHDTPVDKAYYSPRGDRIVTTGGARRAVLWDGASGERIANLRHGAPRAVDDAETAVVVPASPAAPAAPAPAAPAPAGPAAAGAVQVFIPGQENTTAAAFSPDGARVATVDGVGGGAIWATRDGRLIARFGAAPTARGAGGFSSVAFSPNGRRIVTASRDGTARVWDAVNGRPLVLMRGHGGSVATAAFGRGGAAVVTGSYDRTARVWDARSGVTQNVVTGHTLPVVSASFSPDGTRIMTASEDGTVRIESGRTTILRGRAGIVTGASFSPNGQFVVTTHENRTARIWEVTRGRTLPLRNVVAVSPDGKIAVTYEGTGARVWKVATGERGPLLRSGSVESAAFSDDGRLIAIGSDETAGVWEVSTGRRVMVTKRHGGLVLTVAFSRSGRALVTGADGGVARVWNIGSGKRIAVLSRHEDWIRDVAFSPDGSLVVTGSDDTTARIWNARTGRQVSVLRGHRDWVKGVAFSPDGRLVVTASDDGTARVWDTRTGRRIVVLRGHDTWVEDASFSRDGTRIVTASSDETVRVWNRAGDSLGVLPSVGPLLSATFDTDGRHIFTVTQAGAAAIQQCDTCGGLNTLLRLARARVTRKLTADERREFLVED